jgi:hypothetical protein
MLEVHGSEAGMHLTVTIQAVTIQVRSRDREIAERAPGEKLWIWPLSPAYLGCSVAARLHSGIWRYSG